MIDWMLAARSMAAIAEQPMAAEAAVDGAVARAACFQNVEYPVSPLPLFASYQAVEQQRQSLELYVELLAKVVGLYRQHPAIREWYGLSAHAEALIAADDILGDSVQVCRLDGYLEQGTERLQLLENNADAPAGTLFSARINALVAEALRELGAEVPELSELTFGSEDALLRVLLDCLDRAGLDHADPRIAILQYDRRSNRESMEMVSAFRASGVHAVVADPRQIQLRDGHVWFGRDRVNVCWNKINTSAWSQVESDSDVVDRWTAALESGKFVHVNPFGARYLAESKFTLALPREPQFVELFTDAERSLVDDLVPWTRRLSETAMRADGAGLLLTDILDRPSEYVLKQPYDIRGEGVAVGHGLATREWQDAVTRALRCHHIVQQYVRPTAYPVVRPAREPQVITMPTSFDTFVFGGKVGGFGAKASVHPRANLFQGGQKLAVYVPRPQEAECR